MNTKHSSTPFLQKCIKCKIFLTRLTTTTRGTKTIKKNYNNNKKKISKNYNINEGNNNNYEKNKNEF